MATENSLRVKVQLDVRRTLRRGTFIQEEGQHKKWLNFQYEKLPVYCYLCGKMGHAFRECPEKKPEKKKLSEAELPFGSQLRVGFKITGQIGGMDGGQWVMPRQYIIEDKQEGKNQIGKRGGREALTLIQNSQMEEWLAQREELGKNKGTMREKIRAGDNEYKENWIENLDQTDRNSQEEGKGEEERREAEMEIDEGSTTDTKQRLGRGVDGEWVKGGEKGMGEEGSKDRKIVLRSMPKEVDKGDKEQKGKHRNEMSEEKGDKRGQDKGYEKGGEGKRRREEGEEELREIIPNTQYKKRKEEGKGGMAYKEKAEHGIITQLRQTR